jgi:hypothetical protein
LRVALLLALISKDAKLRAVWKSKVAALDDAWWKNFLRQVLALGSCSA